MKNKKDEPAKQVVTTEQVRDGAFTFTHTKIDIRHSDQAAVAEAMESMFPKPEAILRQRADAMRQAAAVDARPGYSVRAAELYECALESLNAITDRQSRCVAGNLVWQLVNAQANELRAMFKEREIEILAGIKDVGAAREANALRSAEAASRYDKWQLAADGIWRKKPNLSPGDVAKILAAKDGETAKPNTIRQKIRKPEKS